MADCSVYYALKACISRYTAGDHSPAFIVAEPGNDGYHLRLDPEGAVDGGRRRTVDNAGT